MPSYSGCELIPSSSYMANGTRFRSALSVMEFEASAPTTFIKDAFDFPTYFSWPGNANTAAVDDGYYSSGYDTTPSQEQETQTQFLAPSAFTQSASPVYAQPPKTDKQTYEYVAGQLDASPPVAEPVEGQYDVEDNFGEFQIHMEGQNTQRTPSTVVQEMDQRSEPEVDDDDDKPLKSRPSRNLKDSTPPGEVKGGNNPYGSKGTKTCGSCRKRKGKCVFGDNPDASCSWCRGRNIECGPKFLKTEFINVMNGQACPKRRVSDIAKDFEKANSNLDPLEVWEMVGNKIREFESEFQRLAKEGNKWSTVGGQKRKRASKKAA